MASSINGATIKVEGSPDIKYYITYKPSRSSNSSVDYDFTIKTYLLGGSSSWIGSGYKLTLYLTINGVQGSVVLKENSEVWSGGSSSGTLKSTKTLSLTCTSTVGNDNQAVTFQVVNKGNLNGTAGEIKTTDYYVTSPVLLYTDCTAPTTFTASSNNFESEVVLKWSGANEGTNNSIARYYIQYAVSSNNSDWEDWTKLKSIESTSTSGEYTADMSDEVSRGYYVKFRIRTEGSAGSSYYSDYKTSSSIRRNPYTKCTAPTSFTMKSDMDSTSMFDIKVVLTWSGATSGSNNAINAYLIQYRTSNDASTWEDWSDLKTIATTKTSGNITVNLSSLVTRKHYVQFRVRTQGQAGSSYYSGWKYYQTSLRRNPYTKCIAPEVVMVSSESDVSGEKYPTVFNSTITIMWDGAKAGENNPIKRYYIEYCTSSDGSIWSNWEGLQSSNLTPVGTKSTTIDVSDKVERGQYIKIQIRTEGEAGSSYYSDYTIANLIRRNSIPVVPKSFEVAFPISLEYSKGDSIKLIWKASTDKDDNLKYYQLQSRITTNGVWGGWTNLDLQISSSSTLYQIYSTADLFNNISNNERVQFRIRAYDNFGEVSSYVTSSVVTRYDMTGVAIGINGKWVNCQLLVGTNASWVEQVVSAGIDNSWVDADGVST